jgi:hypothetical protein
LFAIGGDVDGIIVAAVQDEGVEGCGYDDDGECCGETGDEC